MPSPLHDAVKLPCGLVFPNRLSKVCSNGRNLATSDNSPNEDFNLAYNKWSDGGWGMIMTGNVQVDINHLGNFQDPAVHPDPNTTKTRPPRKTIAPSAIPLFIGKTFLDSFITSLAFPSPREMTQRDIDSVIRLFVDSARFIAESGFSGVELHAAHGYLLDQFLNPKSNVRTDAYGGSAENRAKLLLEFLKGCREVVPATFCIGVKLNSADHSAGNLEDVMAQIGLLVEAGIDFLEVSGGTYENPRMVEGDKPANSQPQSTRTVVREAFFLDFAKETRKRFPNLVLMLTGGFRSRAGAEAAINENACDLVGIARPAAVNPRFAELLLDEGVKDEAARISLDKVRPGWLPRLLRSQVLGAGAETGYYANQIHRLVKGLATAAPGY
ncbi:FMN-linked oxidoreductase [Aspergillus californicus]